VGVAGGERGGAGEEGAVEAEGGGGGGEVGFAGGGGVRGEEPEAGGVVEGEGEGVQGAGGFAGGECGGEAFAAQAGGEAGEPGGEFGEEGCGGLGGEALGEELEVAVDDVAEGADGEAAFGAVEGGGVKRVRGLKVRGRRSRRLVPSGAEAPVCSPLPTDGLKPVPFKTSASAEAARARDSRGWTGEGAGKLTSLGLGVSS
jgi:hypothetical protein